MRRLMFFRVAGRNVHLPRLIGAFILFAALLMFIKASADMFDSWDSLKGWDTCIANISADNLSEQQLQLQNCNETLYKNTGIYPSVGQGKLTSRQFWSALLGPISAILFWLAMLFLGWMLYRTGELVVPIEESVRVLPEKKAAGIRRKR